MRRNGDVRFYTLFYYTKAFESCELKKKKKILYIDLRSEIILHVRDFFFILILSEKLEMEFVEFN